MKTAKSNTNPTQYPKFWDEKWLKIAIDQLDCSKLSPQERVSYEMTLARNAEAVKASNREKAEAEAKGEKKSTRQFILNCLNDGLEIDLIIKLTSTSKAYILEIKESLKN